MSDAITNKELFDYLVAEYNRPFSGWDFSYLDGRREVIRSGKQPWNYTDTVLTAMQQVQSMLDMGTGGGERLARLTTVHPLPVETFATEGYAPNVVVARQRLVPLGVTVREVNDDTQLPFVDNQFDLIINRHASYTPREVQRILKPSGQFITQQVGDQTNRKLHELLGTEKEHYFYEGAQPRQAWDLDYAVRDLQAAGLHIVEQQEELFPTRYYDAGAIAYYLKAIPWEVPDFLVKKYFDKLVEIHHLIQKDGFVDVLFHQFFIVARKM